MLRAIGILVFALMTSVVGGVAALWALGASTASVEECTEDVLCNFASSWLKLGGTKNGGSACLSQDDKHAMAMLASVLAFERPLDMSATKYLGAVTDTCPSVSEAAILICRAAGGGNANDPSKCEMIEKAKITDEPSE